MRKSRRRVSRPRRTGTYRGFHWTRHTYYASVEINAAPAGCYFEVTDHHGKHLGGTTDYKRFIQRWQEQHGVPPEVARKQRERGMARALAGFMRL